MREGTKLHRKSQCFDQSWNLVCWAMWLSILGGAWSLAGNLRLLTVLADLAGVVEGGIRCF